MIDPSQFAQDAAEIAVEVPADDRLKNVATLARRQQALEAEIERLEKELEEAGKRLDRVAKRDLPDAMASCGLSEFKLDDGYRVTVSQEYYANIPSASSDKPELQERRAAAFAWLRANGHVDLIKSEITVSLGRGDDAIAQRVINGLEKVGIPYAQSETIHAQTLKAFVREQIEAGADLPHDTFGVHPERVAKVQPVSKPRKRNQ